MSLIALPFSLPPGFLARLGYLSDRRLVAIWFEPIVDVKA